MDGEYIQDMVAAMREKGIAHPRAVDSSVWSQGSTILDALHSGWQRNRDVQDSNFSKFGHEGEQFNLVGYSYGSLQAAQAAMDYADQEETVDNLVLIGSPIKKAFLEKLHQHPNIKHVHVLDLAHRGDPLYAGISTPELILGLRKLGVQFTSDDEHGTKDGHFDYTGNSKMAKTRRRVLAETLKKLGLK
ncbi:alpha/beta fold hydrolase [Magnetococcus sp. PR-3]|uniref:alpha/beta fold hydrolase n=1 Tax=Magnetococcus sp. PR-3 TaxID=3120355 RepID=UPI002FCE486F